MAEEIELNNISIDSNCKTVDIGLNQAERFTAFQFDVIIPDGTELKDVVMTESNTDHRIYISRVNDNLYRIIGLSLNNEELTSSNNKFLSLSFTGEMNGKMHINNIVFASTRGEKVFFENKSICISNTETMDNADVYDLQGRKYDSNRKQLGRGIYVINGKKVINK